MLHLEKCCLFRCQSRVWWTVPQLYHSNWNPQCIEWDRAHTKKTSVITDNSTANSFVHSEMRVKRSKSWDMCFNWLRDCTAQNQFNIKWDKGIYNMADYFTKHHPPSHHRLKQTDYILKGS